MSKNHARYSPSKLESLLGCLRFKYKDTEGGADEGKLLHKANEDHDPTGLDGEQRDVLNSYWTYVDVVRAKHAVSPVHEKETKLEILDLTFGFCDDILISKDRMDVLDLKTGRKAVSRAAENFQIQCYCVGALLAHPEINECWGHMVSPRVPMSTCHKYTRADISAVIKKIEDLYERLDNPFNRETPSAELCALCSRVATCPSMGGVALAVARGIGLPLPDAFEPGAVVSPRDRARAQLVATALENWAEQVKDNNKKYGEAGGTMDGFELRERSSGEKIDKDASAEAVNRLTAAGYAPTDQLYAAMKLSLPDLAEVGVLIRGGKEAAERDTIRNVLGDLIRSSSYKYWQRVDKKKLPDNVLLGAG